MAEVTAVLEGKEVHKRTSFYLTRQELVQILRERFKLSPIVNLTYEVRGDDGLTVNFIHIESLDL